MHHAEKFQQKQQQLKSYVYIDQSDAIQQTHQFQHNQHSEPCIAYSKGHDYKLQIGSTALMTKHIQFLQTKQIQIEIQTYFFAFKHRFQKHSIHIMPYRKAIQLLRLLSTCTRKPCSAKTTVCSYLQRFHHYLGNMS